MSEEIIDLDMNDDDPQDLVELTEKTGMSLKSRVQIDNLPSKPEGDHTSDLLFALQLYLTGDIGANAIRVTSINDSSD